MAAIRRALRWSLRSQHAPSKKKPKPKPTRRRRRLPDRPGAVPKQHLDSLLDERLRAGIFLRRDDAKLPRHVAGGT